MAYSSGIMDKRVTVIIPGALQDDENGRTIGQPTEIVRWAAVDWNRGTKALREGVIEAYDIVMVRMYYDAQITRMCKLRIEGVEYKINSFHADKHANTIQITATELQG